MGFLKLFQEQKWTLFLARFQIYLKEPENRMVFYEAQKWVAVLFYKSAVSRA